MKNGEHKVFIISGPSRVGKEAITNSLLRKRSLNLKKVVTGTTRERRPSEIEGKHFYFFTTEEFMEKIKDGYFLEWAIYGAKYYGTPIQEIRGIQRSGKYALMNIEVHGAGQVARKLSDVVRIFIKPDSLLTLRKRMERAKFTKHQITDRLKTAKRELAESKKYDYIVVNRDGHLRQTIAEVSAIIKKESET
ncbi:MAG: guanylate kinase [Candidatus Jacksonbacteria bacterium RIFOXYA2_FULL_44_7]|uniref:Guanylate kinase n=1 Tax=Candidatus Jacksonbacteria bacterium RIFCSPLOWO2_02_FULL_44_20 TaxID=1798460 RepID=A0A1G2A8H3_9BACT|nr:MAG: Guanylate kinase [Parcubacteria group bacterium GW2011_GWC2_44_17]OGY70201.1 MAG: guanylate kinase [Candidatus Jacksonbacteria bacterium RIFCSPHIGHO2_02_FULL_44_25]OGY72143.1 MAG: guanylate kinase [Candidatus Jacksonbacteria bacterium RIFCSPHIGHO2_12_FULL_44_12]OGY73198.1 MAG: guanylate kinase [Candidatus Jacksonbacteria bacterium RIFCSPLOWO2_02_FULL_44_20]OGY75138.1 MAG: guanylate kinase [Candidatus Jacksonbacteria bacterium RIFOXYA2_FULL_44_7]HCA67077.1 guanylate kinase [Candidatus J